MKKVKRILLTVAVPFILAISMLTLCSCDVEATMNKMLGEKPVEDGVYKYVGYTFDTEATENAGIVQAKASAATVAEAFVSEVYNPTTQSGEKYYDTLTFKDGKITRLHYTRKTSILDGIEIYTHVDESTSDYGTYKGKNITIDIDDFESAYIKEGVLNVKVKTYFSDTTYAILQFELVD
ncbi:MAG: hypothetical protein E7653_04730 [Ruminococcaceae bacterium]|nr:hypothetical protein [Oscillospiraceae bacterium]